ncbi:MAG: 3-oxoadipate enol-lactonase [Thermoleophilia bacterium]
MTANGIAMNYELTGPADATVVTLSHSLSTDLTMWEPQTAALGEAGCRVLRYDTRGHGGTEAPPGPYSLELLAEDAHALLLALGIERTHFVGISMGGMIGQTLALAHPEILAGLVLCDTAATLPPEATAIWDERIATARAGGMAPHVEATIGRWFTPAFIASHADAVDPVRAMIRATPVEGYAGCAEAIKHLDLLERITAITAPTLVVVGADDPGTPPETARAIQERIPGAELVVIESASHLSNVEQPEVFNRALLEFLRRVG